MRLTFPARVEVLSLEFVESGFDADFTPAIRTGDPFLDRYVDKAKATLYACMRDTYMDCPDRERAQWWGDVVHQLEQTFLCMDTRAHSLARKAVRELAAWQRPDGTLFSPVPAGNWSRELPLQMLASVGPYGFWTYYAYTGDRETLELVYPAARRYVLDVWAMEDTGLVVPREGEWLWGDWGENKDLTALFDPWYALALDGIAAMAAELGHDADAELARTRRAPMKAAYRERFWRGEGAGFGSEGHDGPPDDRVQAMAVLAGFADPSDRDTLLALLDRERHAGAYMEKYVTEALFELDAEDLALGRFRERFAEMVESDLQTLWEDWTIGGSGGGTVNHGWSGVGDDPLRPLPRRLRGAHPRLWPRAVRAPVDPLARGLARVRDRPRIPEPRGPAGSGGPAPDPCDRPRGHRGRGRRGRRDRVPRPRPSHPVGHGLVAGGRRLPRRRPRRGVGFGGPAVSRPRPRTLALRRRPLNRGQPTTPRARPRPRTTGGASPAPTGPFACACSAARPGARRPSRSTRSPSPGARPSPRPRA